MTQRYCSSNYIICSFFTYYFKQHKNSTVYIIKIRVPNTNPSLCYIVHYRDNFRIFYLPLWKCSSFPGLNSMLLRTPVWKFNKVLLKKYIFFKVFLLFFFPFSMLLSSWKDVFLFFPISHYTAWNTFKSSISKKIILRNYDPSSAKQIITCLNLFLFSSHLIMCITLYAFILLNSVKFKGEDCLFD